MTYHSIGQFDLTRAPLPAGVSRPSSVSLKPSTLMLQPAATIRTAPSQQVVTTAAPVTAVTSARRPRRPGTAADLCRVKRELQRRLSADPTRILTRVDNGEPISAGELLKALSSGEMAKICSANPGTALRRSGEEAHHFFFEMLLRVPEVDISPPAQPPSEPRDRVDPPPDVPRDRVEPPPPTPPPPRDRVAPPLAPEVSESTADPSRPVDEAVWTEEIDYYDPAQPPISPPEPSGEETLLPQQKRRFPWMWIGLAVIVAGAGVYLATAD